MIDRLHRTCRATQAETARARAAAEERASRLAERIVIETQRADSRDELLRRAEDAALDRRLRDHTERERLAADLAAARARIVELQDRLGELSARHSSHQAVLEERRGRAAEAALGDAWESPFGEQSVRRAEFARVLMEMPLSFYDVIVSYDPDASSPWHVDCRPLDPTPSYYDAREYLRRRYGLSDREMDTLKRAAERAHRENQREEAF